MPFLRLTRDRRGFENTFLLHADHPGARPRLLYWYRTAPGIGLGRPPLDEDAIRTIEDNHPEIDFDWPAILALSEVMTHEDEEAPPPQRREKRPTTEPRREPRRRPPAPPEGEIEPVDMADAESAEEDAVEEPASPPASKHGLLEELVGREIATRLRARHSEILARIHERQPDEGTRDMWLKRAEALDPEMWVTPEAILEGVRNADAAFERLRHEVLGVHSSRE